MDKISFSRRISRVGYWGSFKRLTHVLADGNRSISSRTLQMVKGGFRVWNPANGGREQLVTNFSKSPRWRTVKSFYPNAQNKKKPVSRHWPSMLCTKLQDKGRLTVTTLQNCSTYASVPQYPPVYTAFMRKFATLKSRSVPPMTLCNSPCAKRKNTNS